MGKILNMTPLNKGFIEAIQGFGGSATIGIITQRTILSFD
jgi:hypothetical protein